MKNLAGSVSFGWGKLCIKKCVSGSNASSSFVCCLQDALLQTKYALKKGKKILSSKTSFLLHQMQKAIILKHKSD